MRTWENLTEIISCSTTGSKGEHRMFIYQLRLASGSSCAIPSEPEVQKLLISKNGQVRKKNYLPVQQVAFHERKKDTSQSRIYTKHLARDWSHNVEPGERKAIRLAPALNNTSSMMSPSAFHNCTAYFLRWITSWNTKRCKENTVKLTEYWVFVKCSQIKHQINIIDTTVMPLLKCRVGQTCYSFLHLFCFLPYD